jgi:hypothetical protein
LQRSVFLDKEKIFEEKFPREGGEEGHRKRSFKAG